jgi:hypothetical protein
MPNDIDWAAPWEDHREARLERGRWGRVQFALALVVIACGVALTMMLAVALLYLLILVAASGAR